MNKSKKLLAAFFKHFLRILDNYFWELCLQSFKSLDLRSDLLLVILVLFERVNSVLISFFDPVELDLLTFYKLIILVIAFLSFCIYF